MLPRSRLFLINLNGSNQLRDVKIIVFGFIILGAVLASSIIKHLPLNDMPFDLTNSSQTCFGAII